MNKMFPSMGLQMFVSFSLSLTFNSILEKEARQRLAGQILVVQLVDYVNFHLVNESLVSYPCNFLPHFSFPSPYVWHLEKSKKVWLVNGPILSRLFRNPNLKMIRSGLNKATEYRITITECKIKDRSRLM